MCWFCMFLTFHFSQKYHRGGHDCHDIICSKFLICSDAPHTVHWLAGAASVRYNQLKGLKPILSLKTSDGAMLSPEDLVSYLLQNNEEVNNS